MFYGEVLWKLLISLRIRVPDYDFCIKRLVQCNTVPVSSVLPPSFKEKASDRSNNLCIIAKIIRSEDTRNRDRRNKIPK